MDLRRYRDLVILRQDRLVSENARLAPFRAPPGVAFDLHFITLLGAIRRHRERCGLGCKPLAQRLGSHSELGLAGSIALPRTLVLHLIYPCWGPEL